MPATEQFTERRLEEYLRHAAQTDSLVKGIVGDDALVRGGSTAIR